MKTCKGWLSGIPALVLVLSVLPAALAAGGQPYDVTVASYLDLAAPSDSIWGGGGVIDFSFKDPSKVARIGLMGGAGKSRDIDYFDTNGKQIDG